MDRAKRSSFHTTSTSLIFLGAPFIETLRNNKAMTGALSAITAVVGVIMNLAVWIALHVLFRQVEVWEGYGLSVDVPVWSSINTPALVLTVAAILAIFQFKVRMIPTLAPCSVAGAALK